MEDKLTASLTPQQWDFVGKLVVDTLNASTAQARLATAVWQSLQAQLNTAKPASNGVAASTTIEAPSS